MSIAAVRFTAGDESDSPEQSELILESLSETVDRRFDGQPVAYVIRASELDALRHARYRGVVEDRRKQREAVELSRLLLRRRRIPFVEGRYRAAGRLIQGICSLLTKAANLGERNTYIIGVSNELFDSLWERAAVAHARSTPTFPVITGNQENWRVWLDRLKDQFVPRELYEKYVGQSDRIRLVRHLILCAARSDDPVLIVGETGTGKEIVARQIHKQGERKLANFIAVNCSAISPDLFESELFGHVEGAFTDASRDRDGLWKFADGGVLFLDEIGDLSKGHQAKILRALETGKIRPVGADKEIEIDARVIAATHRDLSAMVRDGDFRKDLYYRLRALVIPTPPLREHLEDIGPLANHFWRNITDDNRAELPGKIIEELKHHDWPGNARQLRSVLIRYHSLPHTDPQDLALLRSVLD